MVAFTVELLILILGILGASSWLVVAAFRVRPWWALVTLLPSGALVFAMARWRGARAPFLTALACGGLLGGLAFSQPERVAELRQRRIAYQQGKAFVSGDSAANGRPITADPVTAHAAYTKHYAELTTLYGQLATERAALKPGQPATEFNAKAAHYQEAVGALTREKTQLDALDAAVARQNGEAAAALDRLQLLAGAGDLPAFGALMKTCVADYRQSAAFPQMVALGRQTLSGVTADKIAAAVERQTNAARADMDPVTARIRGIVNQTPPSVPRRPGAVVYSTGYHPGATKPDFNAADLLKTRQPYQGEFLYMETVPGVYYRSADCEFNPQTKYFITSRDVPKKKLGEGEYAELTRLYRQLGRDETLIATHAQRLEGAGRVADELSALNGELTAMQVK